MSRVMLVLMAAALAGTALRAQPPGVVRGIVTAPNNTPVAEARVRIMGIDLATLTQTNGSFRVAEVPSGLRTLEVTLLGYTPKRVNVDITSGTTVDVSVVLEPVLLETVTVTANSGLSARMGGFEERRARGGGKFFTREDIARMQAHQVTDILRRVPGMQIVPSGGAYAGGTRTAQSGRSAGNSSQRTCPVAYYVDGAVFALRNDVAINHYLTPDAIAGIEVYAGSSQIPARFGATLSSTTCGVVVIWTRDGIDPRVAR